MTMDIDWDELRAVAADAMTHAYAPYSRYRVGAAALAMALQLPPSTCAHA